MNEFLAIVHVAGEFAAVAAGAGCVYLLFAAAIVIDFPRRTQSISRSCRSTRRETAGVSILKPLHGDEAGLLERLLSFCDQDYDGAVQIVLGCQDRLDPAVLVAKRVAALRPRCDIDVVVDERLYGGNRKVANLIHCFDRARHDHLVIADSDIAVETDYVQRLIEALAPSDVGAVTCLYVGEGETRGGLLSALAIDTHFLPSVLVGTALGAATPCFGSTIALHRETLARIGGLHSIADKLADDYAIGVAVRDLGLAVAIPSFCVRHFCQEPTFGAFFRHQLRVARTIRNIDPLGHVGLLVTNPLPLAIVAVGFSCTSAVWLVAAAVLTRCLLVCAVSRRFDTAGRSPWLQPICDIVLFVVYVASFCGSSVEWRGHRCRPLRDGSLASEEKEATPA